MFASLDTVAAAAAAVPTLAAAGLAGWAGVGWRRVARLRRQLATAHHRATHDPLTRLLNRTGLAETWHQLPPAHRSMLVIDLDGFKPVNDRHGHAAGDQLLVTIAERLRHVPGAVARLGGDEFAILTTYPDPAALARRVADLVAAPLTLTDRRRVRVTASIGVAPAPVDDLTTALAHADAAMYRAKTARSGIAVYHPHRDDRPTLTGDPRPMLRVRDRDEHRTAWQVAA